MKLHWRLSGLNFMVSCGVLLAALLLSGCASEEVVFSSDPVQPGATGTPVTTSPPPVLAPATSTPPVGAESGVFNIGDEVIVTFSDPALQTHNERIKEDGTITLHLIGAVKAAGKTPGELQKEIQGLYVPKYYQLGRLTVTVTSQDRFYHVGGEVRSPNRYVWVTATTVTKAIQSAGDFTDYAKKTAVLLIRADGKTKIKVNCKKAIEDPKLDPPVFPGDDIHVPRRW